MKSCSTIAALLIAGCLFVPSYSVRRKPGICPKVFNTLVAVPPCNYDYECPGDEKCCHFDYGSVCAPAITPTFGCPPPGDAGICSEGCIRGCRKDQICCSTGCGHQCMTPVPV